MIRTFRQPLLHGVSPVPGSVATRPRKKCGGLPRKTSAYSSRFLLPTTAAWSRDTKAHGNARSRQVVRGRSLPSSRPSMHLGVPPSASASPTTYVAHPRMQTSRVRPRSIYHPGFAHPCIQTPIQALTGFDWRISRSLGPPPEFLPGRRAGPLRHPTAPALDFAPGPLSSHPTRPGKKPP